MEKNRKPRKEQQRENNPDKAAMLTCEFLAPREAESLKSISPPRKTASALTLTMCRRNAERLPPNVQLTPSRATRTLQNRERRRRARVLVGQIAAA